jgi:NitT/TauT family transport system permease protein
VLCFLALCAYGVARLAGEWRAPLREAVVIDLRFRALPLYTFFSLCRGLAAFALSFLFTLVYGYVAARVRLADRVLLPLLDILQSIPVLGFMPGVVLAMAALFPHSNAGLELAAILMIFTGQVWNMTFGFYHSMVTIPTDLQEAATNFRLSRWQRFGTLEVPSSMHSLIWNSMLSFGGGWFFVAQSEAISVLNKNIKLPGLGSYMATAVEKGDHQAAFWAIVAMLAVILITDQLVWRPLLAWADKFKIELTESGQAPTSWLYDLLRRSYLFVWIDEKLVDPLFSSISNLVRPYRADEAGYYKGPGRASLWLLRLVAAILGVWLAYWLVIAVIMGIRHVYDHVTWQMLLHIAVLGLLTLGRVLLMTVVATLIWTPAGVWIGSRPEAARIAQPLAQIFASFPTNMTFPLIVGLFVKWHIPMNWGSIFLIAMGTQWYILFNVIAGAMAIPNDLKEAARTYGLHGWARWRTLIIPAIFPFWITGACTAAGGAWNASIVAEVATWGNTQLTADGLGAFITEVTQKGDTPLTICSIVMMSIFVVVLNKLVWRRLYSYAEKRFHLD